MKLPAKNDHFQQIMKRAGIILTAVILVTQSGCLSRSQLKSDWLSFVDKPEYERPLIAIDFYPWLEPGRRLATPVRPFETWNKDSQAYCDNFFRTLGVDIVKLHLDPLIRTAERASQINSYLERVSKHQKYRIMISADCTDLEASEQKAFLTWSMKLNIYESPSCYTLENKPVIELTGATADLEIMGLHLRQRIWLRKHPLLKDSTYFKEAELSLDQTEIRIYAGYKSNLMWKVRRHPIAVRLAFREALQLNTSQVTISSWNHYTNGSFIEPNTYDDNRLFEALKLDITAFRQKTRRPDSGR